MAELLVIAALLALGGLVFWLRQRSGRVIDEKTDALARACSGDSEQARRLEDLEHSRASEPLSRKEARQRALERLIDDRST